jgi:lysozyme
MANLDDYYFTNSTSMKEVINILYKIVTESEGCKLIAYPDPGSGKDPWTIGWGSTGPGICKGTVWTQSQANYRLYSDLEKVVNQALAASPSLLDESPSRQAAIADFIYNCGLANYKSSTLKKEVDKDNYVGARVQIVKWTRAAGKVLKGLVIRRNKEAELLK